MDLLHSCVRVISMFCVIELTWVLFIFDGNLHSLITLTYGPRKAKTCLRTCAECPDSDCPTHAQSIIRAVILHLYIL